MKPKLERRSVDRARRQWLTSGVLLAFSASAVNAAGAAALSVGGSLDRRSLRVRSPEKSVLLAASVAGGAVVAVGERGIVIRSEDDGKTWTQAETPTSVTLTAVLFLDPQRGVAVGHGGLVMQTLDGGRSWQARIDGNDIARLMLEQAKRQGDPLAIKNAERLVAEGPDKPLLALERISGDRIIAAGAYGITVVSDDGGANWHAPASLIDNPKGLHIYAIRAQGRRIVVAGEQGLLSISEDGGDTFSPASTSYRGTFFTADILPIGTIGIAGLRANVFTSDDGGLTWQRQELPGGATINHSAMSGGSWLLANQAGQVIRQVAGGFKPVFKDPLPPINAILPLRSGALLALTVAGIVRVPSIGDMPTPRQ